MLFMEKNLDVDSYSLLFDERIDWYLLFSAGFGKVSASRERLSP